MSLHLVILAAYSLGLMALGLWIGRRLRGAADFFVASRQLGPGLIFSTMLAANIGAGSTVGATSEAYQHGLAAWWWVGSAGVGCTVLALWVGPAMRRIAAEQGLRTVGDYLEFRYNGSVRGIIAALLWIGSLFILASQLIGLGWILNVVTGMPKAIGCAIGGLVVVVYFTAGGLLTSAWVNVVQLAVKLAGFAVALPLAFAWIGGWPPVREAVAETPPYAGFLSATSVKYFALLAPSFVVSPGLLQKVFGARDDRAVRAGVGLNALALFLFAGAPVLLGVIARGGFPNLPAPNLALPTVFTEALPPLAGAIALAAVFSAEVSAADAVMLMLTTSVSQDLYKRFLNARATDDQVLHVARVATVVAGLLGIALALSSEDLVQTLTIFYALLGVSLFVPIVAGLYVRRSTSAGAVTAIVAGVAGMMTVQLLTGGAGYGVLTPAPAGLIAAAAAWAIVTLVNPAEAGSHNVPGSHF
ncbi:MAG TPA: sodium:solute symporter family protein [Vicinamibacterales bacterium]